MVRPVDETYLSRNRYDFGWRVSLIAASETAEFWPILVKKRGDNQPRPFRIDDSLSIQRSSFGDILNLLRFISDRYQCAYRYDSPNYRNKRRYPDREGFWGFYFFPIARLLSPFIILLGALLQYERGVGVSSSAVRWRCTAPCIVPIVIGGLLMLDAMGW